MVDDVKSRRDEHSEATRAALLSAARELFGKQGYNDTSIEMVASAAHVTTGAIYHHFHNKKDLFKATAEALQEALLAEATSTVGHAGRWERLRAGYDLMLERLSDDAVHRILFVEAPQVLGPGPWREIELRYVYGTSRDLLQALIKRRVVRNYPATLLARLLVGLLREASSEISESGNDPGVRAQVAELVERVFCSIRTDTSP
jgi:AcrR family transcriptional regulator